MDSVYEFADGAAARRQESIELRHDAGNYRSSLRMLIASDSQVAATALAERLGRLGQDCSPSSSMSIPAAIESLQAEYADVELVFLLFSSDFQGWLADVQRMRRHTSAKIVAVGATRNPQQALQLIRAGASDVIGVDDDGAELLDVLTRLTREIRDVSRSGVLIPLSSACGGVGKSILCANLGVALATTGNRCGLIDLNLRGGDLATLLNVKPRHTIDDLLSLRDSIDGDIFKQSLTEHWSGLRLLAGPQMHASHSPASAPDLRRVIEISRRLFDVTIVDIGHAAMTEAPDWLDVVNQILLVTRLDFLAMVRTRKYMLLLERAGAPLEKIRVIANRFGQSSEVPLEKVQQALQLQISYFVPDDPRTINNSVNVGAPFVTEAPTSKAAESIREIAADLAAMAAAPGRPRPLRPPMRSRFDRVLSMLGIASTMPEQPA